MNWILIFFIVLVITGVLLLFYGVKNKSLASMLFGGGALVAPILYHTDMSFLMPMIPAVAMGILYLVQKKSDTV